MPPRPDFSVYSADERLQLSVEVKFRPGASDEWAEQYRRNLLTHSVVPESTDFLLVLPDYSYLWRATRNEEEPGAVVKLRTEDILRSYFTSVAVQPSNEEGLELAINAWLSSVMHLPKEELEKRHGWLVRAGVYDRIRGGHVEYRAAA